MKPLLVGINIPKIGTSPNELKIYEEILKFNGISYIILDSSQPAFWAKVKSLDLFIYKWGHDHHSLQLATSILPVVEKYYGIKCFPDLATCWHYDDKVKQYLLLKSKDFPAVESYVFWDINYALNWIEGHEEFPIVFKLKNGAGALSVFLVRTKKEAKALIKRMFRRGLTPNASSPCHLIKTLNFDFKTIFRFYAINFRNKYLVPEKQKYWLRQKNYIYFQRFMAGNSWDTRVTTAGNRAHAFRRFNRPNDFRASGSNNWDIDPEKIDLRMVKIALDVSKYFGFQAMAYDFVYDEHREPKIVEMSYLYGGAGYPDFMNGYWDENLKRHEGRYWPQYFELSDLLGIELELPELETDSNYRNIILKQN